MPLTAFRRVRFSTAVPTTVALAAVLGWASREVAFARERAALVGSATITLDQVKMEPYAYEGKPVGKAGVYLSGDTPGSTKFVTGRFVLEPGQTPHPPHVHDEEEVMVIESGHGDIVVGDKVTKVGPGSVMYTTPKEPHGIVNTGKEPIVFYFIKWVGKPAG